MKNRNIVSIAYKKKIVAVNIFFTLHVDFGRNGFDVFFCFT